MRSRCAGSGRRPPVLRAFFGARLSSLTSTAPRPVRISSKAKAYWLSSSFSVGRALNGFEQKMQTLDLRLGVDLRRFRAATSASSAALDERILAIIAFSVSGIVKCSVRRDRHKHEIRRLRRPFLAPESKYRSFYPTLIGRNCRAGRARVQSMPSTSAINCAAERRPSLSPASASEICLARGASRTGLYQRLRRLTHGDSLGADFLTHLARRRFAPCQQR